MYYRNNSRRKPKNLHFERKWKYRKEGSEKYLLNIGSLEVNCFALIFLLHNIGEYIWLKISSLLMTKINNPMHSALKFTHRHTHMHTHTHFQIYILINTAYIHWLSHGHLTLCFERQTSVVYGLLKKNGKQMLIK